MRPLWDSTARSQANQSPELEASNIHPKTHARRTT